MSSTRPRRRRWRPPSCASYWNTERKVSAALETEVRTANGKPQVRAEIVGAREEIRQLKYKIWERENEITELRRENRGLRALLKKANT